MEIPHQVYKIDINKINEPLTRMIESVNDKGVRYVDVELWANSQRVTLSENCTATATFVTDGFLLTKEIECDISDDLTTVTVPIDNAKIESKSGIMLVEIEIKDENGNILTTPFAFKVRVKKSIADSAGVSEKSYGTVAEILKEVAAARGDSQSLKEAIAIKADKSTTYTKQEVDTALSEVNTALSGKLNNVPGCIKRENLEIGVVGFDEIEMGSICTGHISNGAITADKIASEAVETDKIASKAVTSEKIANGAITSSKLAKNSVSSNSIVDNQIGTAHLKNGTVTTDKLADEVKTLINSKYSGSNVETGSGNLTVNTPSAISSELVKSCSFCYQKTGTLVNIFFNIVFNAGSIGYVQFTGLPFKGNTTTNQIRTQTVTTMNNQVTYYPVNNWLTLNFSGTKTFAQDETLKGVITIQIT